MRLSRDEDDTGGGDDYDQCPYCGAWIEELANDVSDDDYRDESKDIAAVDCPECGKTIALIREHNYRLAKFVKTPAGDGK